MPYYGSNNADPGEMQGMSGNPFYNPLQQGPDWVRGVQAIYGQMAQVKDKKKAEQEAADNKFKEAMLFQLKLREEKDSAKLRAKQLEKLEREAKDYISPIEKDFRTRMEDKKKAEQEHKYRVAEINARGAQDRAAASTRAGEDEGKLEATEKKAIFKGDIVNRRRDTKRLDEIKKALDANEKRMVDIKYKWSVAKKNKNEAFAGVAEMELERIKQESEMLQSEFDTIAEKYASSIGGGDAEASLPAGFQIIK